MSVPDMEMNVDGTSYTTEEVVRRVRAHDGLVRAAQELAEAVRHTPMGVRAIKALDALDKELQKASPGGRR